MNRGVRMRDRSHLPDDVSKRILLRDHVEQIRTAAYNPLNPFRVQIVRKPHSIVVAIRFHLEHELADPSKTEAAMPPGIRQDLVRLPVMRVLGLPRPVSMHRSPPALVVDRELERVEIVLQPKVQDLRYLVAPSEKVYRVPARYLVDVRHDQQVVVSDPRDSQKLIQCDPLIGLFVKRILLPFLEPPSYRAVGQPRLDKLKLVLAVSREDERFR